MAAAKMRKLCSSAGDHFSWIRNVVALYAPVIFARGVSELAVASTGDGIRWYEINDDDARWPFLHTPEFLVLDPVLYLLVAFYLDSIYPVEYGVSQRPWFFLLPSYWLDRNPFRTKWAQLKSAVAVQCRSLRQSRHGKGETSETLRKGPVSAHADYENELELSKTLDSDVARERMRILFPESPETENADSLPPLATKENIHSLEVFNLRKVYRKYPFPTKYDFTAVKGICFSAKENDISCLLGHNGAGKTATFNMLVGMFASTSGDCKIYGYSVRDDIAIVRQMLGFCPQHDLLWPNLTAREHLRIFAAFKNIPARSMEDEINKLLTSLSLLEWKDVRVSQYSGGLRRRLSVAIALLGDPKILFFDEPTTGMSPQSIQECWDIIRAAAVGKLVILTTHSMEEAEMLSSKIGILSNGQFVALGTAHHLSRKFGGGRSLKVTLQETHPHGSQEAEAEADSNHATVQNQATSHWLPRVEAFYSSMLQVVPAAAVVRSGREFLGECELAIPLSVDGEKMEKLLELVESGTNQWSVASYTIGVSSLQDVFLRIAAADAVEDADTLHAEGSVSGDPIPLEDAWEMSAVGRGDKAQVEVEAHNVEVAEAASSSAEDVGIRGYEDVTS